MSTEKKGRGRPPGSLSGSIVKRMGKNLSVMAGKINTMGNRVAKWAEKETDEKMKASLTGLANLLDDFQRDINENAVVAFDELTSDGWKPPKSVITTKSVEYPAGTQVWVKADQVPNYVEMGFEEAQLKNLFVANVVNGKVVVTAGKNGKVRIPLTKSHVTKTEPTVQA